MNSPEDIAARLVALSIDDGGPIQPLIADAIRYERNQASLSSARWDALMQADMHWMGSSGFDPTKAGDMHPRGGEPLHFGAEIWSKHPSDDFGKGEQSKMGDRRAKSCLTHIADRIIDQTLGSFMPSTRDLALEECAGIADVFANTEPDLAKSDNPTTARIIASIIADTGKKIAERIRSRKSTPSRSTN